MKLYTHYSIVIIDQGMREESLRNLTSKSPVTPMNSKRQSALTFCPNVTRVPQILADHSSFKALHIISILEGLSSTLFANSEGNSLFDGRRTAWNVARPFLQQPRNI